MGRGLGRVTHLEPPLAQGSWGACSCPGRKKFHLGTDGSGQKEGSSRLQRAPCPERQGDSDMGGGRWREGGRGRERHTQRGERSRDGERVRTRDKGREIQREETDTTQQTHTKTQRVTQAENKMQKPVPAKTVAPRNPSSIVLGVVGEEFPWPTRGQQAERERVEVLLQKQSLNASFTQPCVASRLTSKGSQRRKLGTYHPAGPRELNASVHKKPLQE